MVHATAPTRAVPIWATVTIAFVNPLIFSPTVCSTAASISVPLSLSRIVFGRLTRAFLLNVMSLVVMPADMRASLSSFPKVSETLNEATLFLTS